MAAATVFCSPDEIALAPPFTLPALGVPHLGCTYPVVGRQVVLRVGRRNEFGLAHSGWRDYWRFAEWQSTQRVPCHAEALHEFSSPTRVQAHRHGRFREWRCAISQQAPLESAE